MKLKLTVGVASDVGVDVVVTSDVTATIGELARKLVLGQPTENPSPYHDVAYRNSEPLTLRVRYPNNDRSWILDSVETMNNAGLQSGCWVEVIRPSEVQASDVRHYPRLAVATIVDGLHAGTSFDLVAGSNLVGRGRGCRVRLQDRGVSRTHALLEVTAVFEGIHQNPATRIVVADLNSGNGVYVNGTMIATAELGEGAIVTVGGTKISMTRVVAPPVLDDAPTHSPVIEFDRSPRVEVRFAQRKVAAPVPPARGEPQKFPILAMVAPLVMGGVMFAVTQNVLSIVFIALSPIIMLGTYIDNLVTGKRKKKENAKQFEEALVTLNNKLIAERAQEREVRTNESPSTADVTKAMLDHAPLLWTRRPEHQGFLEIRLGLGAQPSRLNLELPSRTDSDGTYWERLDEVMEANKMIAPVPVLEKFDRAGSIGVAGESVWSNGLMRSIIAQLCGLHSPADLVVACFADPDNQLEWDWLKWLPHVGSIYSPVAGNHLVAEPAPSGYLLAQLEEVLEQRRGDTNAGGSIRSHLNEDASIDELHGLAVQSLPTTPVIVVVVTSHSQVDRGRLVALAEEGPDYGIHLLWHAPTTAGLPAACRTYVDVLPDATGVVGFVRSSTVAMVSPLEMLSEHDAATVARRLSSVLDSGARALDESDLPGSVSYQDLRPESVISSAEAVADLWARSHSLVSRWAGQHAEEASALGGIVGQSTTGVLRLDLREHGPHALVGGTTGAGKSEFLQSWIMGMASEHSPDRLTFLLVDYKGGAAFAECTNLPHTVGLVTDLNQHLVRRALLSLRAELHYRENLLNDKGAKDLISLEKRGDPEAPPSLVIVIDEFAALVGEVPEFVDGVVDVAQRGRSLGLHLIMATQRPAGVIKDNLRANTNLRIALRVADESDSQDVIGSKDAAGFDPGTPGRGAAKLGPGKLLHFQTGYLGGRSLAVAKMPDIGITAFPFELREDWVVDVPTPPVRKESPRDIEGMLLSIQRAADTLGLAVPRKPWLNQLEPLVDLATLQRGAGQQITLGMQDEPERQRQSEFGFNPEVDGNVSIMGTSGSGKSATLRTLAISASLHAAELPVQIFALDFAGGALGTLEVLPTVGSVILGDDSERVERLFRQLSELAAERSVRFSKVPASTLSEYRALTGDHRESRVLVLIDGMANFRSAFEFRNGDDTFATLAQLMSVGRQVGLHFVITGDRPGVIPSGLTANIQQSIVLRMAAASDYGILGVPGEILEDAPAGRSVIDGHEAQLAILGGSSSLTEQSDSVIALAERLVSAGVPSTPPVKRLSEEISLADLPSVVDGRAIVGVADRDLLPVGISPEGLIVVTGPFRSGKTSAMKTLIRVMPKAIGETDAVLLAPTTRSQLLDAYNWGESATGADESETLARELSAKLRDGIWPKSGAQGFIVVEASGDFEGSPAESTVANLIKAARKANILVVVETNTSTGAAAWQIHSELKSARTGILLQPEEGDGIALFRVALPRGSRADFPEGRGYIVEAGRALKLQIAIADD